MSDDFWLADDVRPLGQMLLHSARRTPDKDALVFPDTRLQLPRAGRRGVAVGRSLIGLGVQAGDRVGVLMTNHPDLVLSVFGASMVGAVVVPINARYRTSELRFIVDDAQLTALLTHDSADDHVDYAALLEEALGDGPRRRW